MSPANPVCRRTMLRNPDAICVSLVLGAALGFAYGVWSLAGASEVPGLFWLISAGLMLEVASHRERSLGAR